MDVNVQIVRKIVKRVGIAEGEKLYDHDYNFDEHNVEIEKLFEGVASTTEIVKEKNDF